MEKHRYSEKQQKIINGEIPLDQIMVREVTRIVNIATETNDTATLKIVKPILDSMKVKQNKNAYDYVNRYNAEQYYRASGLFPSSYRDQLQKAASDHGMSLSNFIVMATCEKAGLPIPQPK